MKPRLPAVMVLGCSSHAGKSLLAAAFCRLLARRGLRVAPYKAQNMSLNSGPTLDGAEISRAQIVQAEFAGVLPQREMNPVLLKPSGKGHSQVLVKGRAIGRMSTRAYYRYWPKAALAARQAYAALQDAFQALVIEGAGSPAEINLASRDLANIETARFSGAPFVLVVDIERGGSFAAVKGTLDLIPAWLRKRLIGVVFNKFRGDASLLKTGLDVLARQGIKTLGVLPYFAGHGIDEEDSLGFPAVAAREAKAGVLRIEIQKPGSLANFNDVRPLLVDAGIDAYWRKPGEQPRGPRPDAVVLPGNRMTLADVAEANRLGEFKRYARWREQGTWFLGICGGLQTLGHEISDPLGIDGVKGRRVAGLGFLDARTVMGLSKIARPSRAKLKGALGGPELKGYEIHFGRTTLGLGSTELAVNVERDAVGMAIDPKGTVWGTYFHGVLNDPGFRTAWLKACAKDQGKAYKPAKSKATLESRMDAWTDHVGKHLQFKPILKAMGL